MMINDSCIRRSSSSTTRLPELLPGGNDASATRGNGRVGVVGTLGTGAEIRPPWRAIGRRLAPRVRRAG
jgi:hypothetical protein